jgi:hypothetical protein
MITNPAISVLMKEGEEGAAERTVADYNNGEEAGKCSDMTWQHCPKTKI